MEEWWRHFGEYYVRAFEIDRLDAMAEREAEAAWKLLALDPGSRVVDAPCGFGRHAVRLATWGFEVWGIDVDARLLDEARTRAKESGVEVRLDEGDLRDIPVPAGWAHAVLNLTSSIGLFDSDADNRTIFAEALRVLEPGGRFLIETTHRDREIQHHATRDFTDNPDGTLVLRERDFDMAGGRLESKLTIVAPDGKRTRLVQRPRVYSITELAAELDSAGFTDVSVFGGWRREPPSVDAKIVALARKP